MSEEADAVIESLLWLVRTWSLDRFMMKQNVLQYEAYASNLETKISYILWTSMRFPEEITPPGVIYFSRNMAKECADFNNFDWVKERGWHGEVLA